MEKNIELTPSQQNALERIKDFIGSPSSRIFILKGYAGTGKTTLVKVILNEMEKAGQKYILMASTGRAAKVLTDATDTAGKEPYREPARTIHSQIYRFKNINQDMDSFNKDASDFTDKAVKLKFDLMHHDDDSRQTLYIVDEASMISDEKSLNESQAEYGNGGRLLHDLLEFDSSGKFLFIGDNCQLPPINQPFSPALQKEYFRRVFDIEAEEAELTQVMRQSDGNDITMSATRIRKLYQSVPSCVCAKFPFRGYRNIHIVNSEIELLNMYVNAIKNKDYSKATLITMSNRSIFSISEIVRKALGLSNAALSENDLLLVTQNNMISGLMNGDLIKVLRIGERIRHAGLTFAYVEVESLATHRTSSQLIVEDIITSGTTNLRQDQQSRLFIDYHYRMKDIGIKQNSEEYKRRMTTDPYLNALRCTYGYALTCHKAQGGEWDNVFLNIPRGLPYNEPRSYAYQWVSTAMTRAKKELYVINDYWIC